MVSNILPFFRYGYIDTDFQAKDIIIKYLERAASTTDPDQLTSLKTVSK